MAVPTRITALNKILPQGVLRWRLSSSEALEAAARKSTGRKAELTPSSREALKVLLASYSKTARLHPLGEIMTAVNLLSMLKHQLGLNAAVAQSPATTERAIKTPLVITGLPRTGSTLLHNLLALDEQWRVPLSWEATQPAPLAESTATRRYRIFRAQAQFALIERLNPGFRAIHELDANLPQECLVIQAAAMRSHLYFSSAFVPDYQDWLDDQPQHTTYTHHRLFLQFLQTDTTKSWALKAPSHLFSLQGLLEAYPDVRLVHTHREPQQVVASIASLQWHLYQTFSDFTDVEELGRQVCNRWGLAHRNLTQALAASDTLRKQTFSLEYGRFTDDPLGQIKALYAHFNLKLSPDTETKMRTYLQERPQHHFGKHLYKLADYGLTEHSVLEAFGD